MLVEEQKLRWAGIDMRARWRRRLAVVVTYAAFLVAIWAPTWRMYTVVQQLLYISLLFPLTEAFDIKDLGAHMRWIVRGVITIFIASSCYFVWHWSLRPHLVRTETAPHGNACVVGSISLLLLVSRSPVAWTKLIENSVRGWMAKAIRKGDAASGWEKRRLARRGYALGLEGFAWYEYTTKFRKLTGQQKEEIEAMHYANPRGKWMREREQVLFDDERLQNEEAQLRARVQKIMSVVLVGLPFASALMLEEGSVVSGRVVVAGLWTLAAMMTTLRQAIPLWTESDPRVVPGELAVVGEMAG